MGIHERKWDSAQPLDMLLSLNEMANPAAELRLPPSISPPLEPKTALSPEVGAANLVSWISDIGPQDEDMTAVYKEAAFRFHDVNLNVAAARLLLLVHGLQSTGNKKNLVDRLVAHRIRLFCFHPGDLVRAVLRRPGDGGRGR